MKRRVSTSIFLLLQLPVIAALAWSLAVLSPEDQRQVKQLVTRKPAAADVRIERNEALVIAPLYDDPQLVSDEELAAVLKRLAPRFSTKKMRPNQIEHALRTWHVGATFQEPGALSGVQMRDFLINYGEFVKSWEPTTEPLLQDRPNDGVFIRWGREEASASVHHDHLLACLTEAGVPRSEPVFTPGRRDLTFGAILNEALRDFRFDEREVEWSVMAFGLWLAPTKSWRLADGREMSFDLLAERLMRGHCKVGTCGGTHRLYSLMVLLRLDESHGPILSPNVRQAAFDHLAAVRDILTNGQFDDGHWPYNWPIGKEAVDKPDASIPLFRHVIATGHHLEWLAIAPETLHPPRDQIRQAAAWVIQKTLERTDTEIISDYTFYSHVANAMCLWRKTTPAKFWMEWETTHPFVPPAAH